MATKFRGRFAALVAVLFDRPLRVKFGQAGEGHFFPGAGRVLPVIGGADGVGEGVGGEGDAAAKAAAEKATADKAAKEAEAKASAAEAEEDDLLKGADNPDAVRNAIKAERERAKAAKDEAKAKGEEAESLRAKVQEFEDRDKSAQEKAEKRAKDAEDKAAKAEHKLLRLEVAAAKKVPANLASRLVGETKTELEADADELLKSVKADDTVKLDGGARKTAKGGTDMNQRIREMAGRG